MLAHTDRRLQCANGSAGKPRSNIWAGDRRKVVTHCPDVINACYNMSKAEHAVSHEAVVTRRKAAKSSRREMTRMSTEIPNEPPVSVHQNHANPSTYDVFLSYSCEDRAIALEIRDELCKGGVNCFVAEKDVPGASDFEATIRTALQFSKIVLVLLTPRSVARPWVVFETGEAWVLQKPLLPVLMQVSPDTLMGPVRRSQGRVIETIAQHRSLIDEVVNLSKARILADDRNWTPWRDLTGTWTGTARSLAVKGLPKIAKNLRNNTLSIVLGQFGSTLTGSVRITAGEITQDSNLIGYFLSDDYVYMRYRTEVKNQFHFGVAVIRVLGGTKLSGGAAGIEQMTGYFMARPSLLTDAANFGSVTVVRNATPEPESGPSVGIEPADAPKKNAQLDSVPEAPGARSTSRRKRATSAKSGT